MRKGLFLLIAIFALSCVLVVSFNPRVQAKADDKIYTEQEDNNTEESANVWELGYEVKGTVSEGDVDYYKFTLSYATKVVCYCTYNPYDENNAIRDDCLSFGIISENSISITDKYTHMPYGKYEIGGNFAAETYTIVISGKGSSTDYRLRLSFGCAYLGEWTVTTPVTCLANGARENFCEVCQEVHEEAIIAEGHDFKFAKTVKKAGIFVKGNDLHVCAVCGEEKHVERPNNLWLLPVIIVGGAVLVLGLLNYLKMMKTK